MRYVNYKSFDEYKVNDVVSKIAFYSSAHTVCNDSHRGLIFFIIGKKGFLCARMEDREQLNICDIFSIDKGESDE